MASSSSSSNNKEDVKICRDCGGQIVWREGHNRFGEVKFYPFDYDPNKAANSENYERHRCAEYTERAASRYKGMSNADKAKGIPCRICGAPIIFSEDQRSPTTGKMIPLELNLQRHQHRVNNNSNSSTSPTTQERQQQQQQQQSSSDLARGRGGGGGAGV